MPRNHFSQRWQAATLLLSIGLTTSVSQAADPPAAIATPIRFESLTLDEQEPVAHVDLLYRDSPVEKRPVILMLGSLKQKEPPYWAGGLLDDGYILAAFRVDYPPDPDPARRPVFLYFDQRFAHSYFLLGQRVVQDAPRIMDTLSKRTDVAADKFGWMGSSSTGIPGLALATSEPRLKAVVAFVSTGAYEQWIETWHTNGLWKGQTKELWPETKDLFPTDPIRHVDTMFPCAIQMVSGGADKVVDAATARSFIETAKPFYKNDPERLRLVIYDGWGHNLPRDVVTMFTENWFRLYLHPTNPPPAPPAPPKDLKDSVKRTQINSEDHKDVVGGEQPKSVNRPKK
jgi:dienelactone hydrolase